MRIFIFVVILIVVLVLYHRDNQIKLRENLPDDQDYIEPVPVEEEEDRN